jgi:HEAT repeat protein
MSDNPEDAKKIDELKKLANIATDMELAGKMRIQAIDQLGEIGTHESLLILLNLAANDKLNIDERDRALKRARDIIKKGR